MVPVEVKIKRLPKNLKKEVEDFVDFLLEKKYKRRSRKPKLDWIGGLKEFKCQYTALELQMKANEWIAKRFNLDFDDAYQYSAAKNRDLQLVSFDKDFNDTDINRKEPHEIEN